MLCWYSVLSSITWFHDLFSKFKQSLGQELPETSNLSRHCCIVDLYDRRIEASPSLTRNQINLKSIKGRIQTTALIAGLPKVARWKHR